MKEEQNIALHKISKLYANQFKALNQVELTIPKGSFFALLGPNGAGKTTLINLLTTLMRPSSGQAFCFGYHYATQPLEIASLIGIVPQEVNMNVFHTVQETLFFQAGCHSINRKSATPIIENILKKLQLWQKKDAQVRRLSGGMKRRLMIARALVHQPKILFLDEPTVGIDIELRQETWHFLKELNAQGMTIILTTHHLDEAEFLCNRVAILNHGKVIYQGDIPKETQSNILSITVKHTKKISNDQLDQFKAYQPKRIDSHTANLSLHYTQKSATCFKLIKENQFTIAKIHQNANKLESIYQKILDEHKSH